MGRNAAGVRAMRLRADDVVASADVLSADDARHLLVVTSTGSAKRTAAQKFPRKKRGGLGVIAVKLPDAESDVVGARLVDIDDEVLLVSSSGVLIRTPVREISEQDRPAAGVRGMALADGEEVVAIALVELPDIPESDNSGSEPRKNPAVEVSSTA